MIIILFFLVCIMSAAFFVYVSYKDYKFLKAEKNIEKFYREYSAKDNYVCLDNISTNLKMMIIGTEDNRFFSHGGIDYKQIVYAAYKNICSGRRKMGGSTITQQLAKNLYLSFEKTYRRKMIEFFLAHYIESRLSKRQIFELYLNVIYYGKDQYGINDAASFWFQKNPCDIGINEALTLSALLPAPTKYNPLSEYGLFPRAKKLALKKLRKHNLVDNELAELLEQCEYNGDIVSCIVHKWEKLYADEYDRREKILI